MFQLHFGLEKLDEKQEKICRKAIKGIVVNGTKILLIKTNRGDYKFPGGGVKKAETDKECLEREFLEETGYQLVKINEPMGEVLEQNYDIYDNTKIFSMHSFYYKCELDFSVRKELELDQYEKELNFKASFVEIEEAYENNKRLLYRKEEGINPWVLRETCVLEEIMKVLD